MHEGGLAAEEEDRNYIMKQGERDDRMFIILEGMVRVSRSDGSESENRQRTRHRRPTQSPQVRECVM